MGKFKREINTKDPFTEKDRTLIKLFCRNCDQLKNSRFFKTCQQMNHSYGGNKKPDGSWEHRVPVYDQDDRDSFFTYLRKLFLSKEETNVFRILNILKKDATEEEITVLRQMAKSFEMKEDSFVGIRIVSGNNVKRQLLTPKFIWDTLLYAQVIKTDLKRQGDLEIVEQSWSVVSPFFIPFVLNTAVRCIRISETMKARGYVTNVSEG